ncbi:amidohydrolase family protein [Emcibacter sp.]|uniref:amidohydrolase family protein n=1 Tax=Emcibacter sp. TaxID=1979954 RepID=UPI003A912980
MTFLKKYSRLILMGCAWVLPVTGQAGEALPLNPTRLMEFETNEGTWMSLDVSPDGRNIVFDLLGDLYELKADGGKARRITSGMAFDTQPVFSPDGRRIAYVSDRSGAENLWVLDLREGEPRQVSFQDSERAYFSPQWSADGSHLYVSVFRPDQNGHALWKFPASGNGKGVQLSAAKVGGHPQSVTGAMESRDGKYLYYAYLGEGLDLALPVKWSIRRRHLETGEEETLVKAVSTRQADRDGGSYFRPVVSSDGQKLAYGVRHNGMTGLKVRDMEKGTEKWLAFPILNDQLQATHVQDILPRYSFTPDGKEILITDGGRIVKIDVKTGEKRTIPFTADVSIGLGPRLTAEIRQEEGPVSVRIIHTPRQSPDGRKLVFSALGAIYVMDLENGARPAALTDRSRPSYHPVWSKDGKSLAYVTWSAREGGHVWLRPLDGAGKARKLTDQADVYRYPAFGPEGRYIYVQRTSHNDRLLSHFEYGNLKDASLLRIDLVSGKSKVIYQGNFAGGVQFQSKKSTFYLMTHDGLIALDQEGRQLKEPLNVVGTNWYFLEGSAQVDSMKIHPDGNWLLVQSRQQLYLVPVSEKTTGMTLDLFDEKTAAQKLTTVGADYFDWADGGQSIIWSIGSSIYRRSLEGGEAEVFEAPVELPRDTPKGTLVLRGATLVTMDRQGVLENGEIHIQNNKIAAIGSGGSLAVPKDARILDLKGKYIIPGLIDTHHHVGEVRRDLLDFESWGLSASLAYGVTTLFDPSSLTLDPLDYADLVEAGLITGSRLYSTGPAIFSFNNFRSPDEIREVFKRYRDHYRIRNLKMYKTGNRRVRQWFAQIAAEMDMMVTSEGGLALKHGLTQVIDGFAGHEHALPTAPLYKDVVELMSQSRVAYTLTLLITNGSYEGQNYFITRDNPAGEGKLNRFWPRDMINGKFLSKEWFAPELYRFPQTAESAARIQRTGGLLGVGAHGEAPGIGTHWEMEAYAMGGMTPEEILNAATLGGAEAIGRSGDLGSLTVGKLADLVVLTENPLKNIRHTRAIDMVMKNGRLYKGESLDEIWPRQKAFVGQWFRAERAN